MSIPTRGGSRPRPWEIRAIATPIGRICTSYISGLVLALLLTAVPFALVYWHAMTTSSLLLAIGVFALVQAVVHFRCFLHVDLSRGSVDHLLLVLFSAVILIMMAGGTVWILGNLHSRMY